MTPVAVTFALVENHPRAIRWRNWINFPLLTIMIWSGLLIYWAESVPPNRHAHEVYRLGIGSWTLFRFFPGWFSKSLTLRIDSPQAWVGIPW